MNTVVVPPVRVSTDRTYRFTVPVPVCRSAVIAPAVLVNVAMVAHELSFVECSMVMAKLPDDVARTCR